MTDSKSRSTSSPPPEELTGSDEVHIHIRTCQTPPDVKVVIERGDPLIRLASLGQTSRGTFMADTEYWRTTSGISSSTFDVDDMTLDCTPLAAMTGLQISSWFDTFTAAFTHGRVITAAGWSDGEREVQTGRRGYLFAGADPDDNQKRIGVLIEQDEQSNAVVAVAWYKTYVPENCQIWSAAEPLSIELTRVKDGQTPTTDPSFIAGNQQDWYHTVMGSA